MNLEIIEIYSFFPINEIFITFTNIFVSSNSVMERIIEGTSTYISEIPSNSDKCPRKMSLLLDLDCTLVNSLNLQELRKLPREVQRKFRYVDMKGYYRIFQRPYLQAFLDYAFSNFEVSVFTAADKDYALFIIENLILTKPNRHLKNVFHGYTSELSEAYFDSPKDLRLLWDVLKIDGLAPCSTILLDDLSEVFEANPRNVVRAKKFELLKNGKFDRKQLHDNFLLEVIPKLETRKQKFSACCCRCLVGDGSCDC